MPTFQALHDPAVLAAYGLPAGTWAWLIELDADELAAQTKESWSGYGLILVGVENWSVDRDDVWTAPNMTTPQTLAGGWGPFDIAFVEVQLEGTSTSLQRHIDRTGASRLDARDVQNLEAAEVGRLRRARHLAMLDWDWVGRPGRPKGTYAWSEVAFEIKAREVRAYFRSRRQALPNEDVYASKFNIQSLVTLRSYFQRAGTSWPQVQRGEWPPEI
jgi:hypothetical protein